MRTAVRRAASLAAATALCTGLPLLASTAAHAETTVAVPNAAEAWYASGMLPCTAPVGCLGGQTSYPAQTLHVATSLGAEAARTYLAPDLSKVPAGAQVRSGEMTLPVADAASGSTAVAAATLRACLVTAAISDGVAQGTAGAPAVDCAFTAPLVAASDATSYTLDLAPFLEAWAGGLPRYGVALLPADGQAATAEWRVVFNARGRSGATPITSRLTLAADAPAALGGPADRPVAPAPVPLPAGPSVVVALPAAQPSPSSAPSPVSAVVPAAPAAPAAGAPQLARVPALSYRGVVYLPLVFLVAVAFLVRTFARPIPVTRSERHL